MKRLRRNIGIIAHVDAGKTTLTERILFDTGRIHKVGDVHYGNTEMDSGALEKKHGITISAAATTCEWRDASITIIDTPGHVDFTVEVERSLRVLDSAVCVVSAVAGVEPQSETVWRQAHRFDVPRICFINKMDQAGADFFACLEMFVERLGACPVVLQLPIGSEGSFTGVVDLVMMQALLWDAGSPEMCVCPIPDALAEEAQLYRRKLLEQIVEIDDSALAHYLENEDGLDEATLRSLIRKGCCEGRFHPVLCGSAFRNIGVQPLLDSVVDYCPAPSDRPAIEGRHPHSGDLESRQPIETDPLVALISKVQMSRYGALSFVRIYSGRLQRGMLVLNATSGRSERVGRLLRMHADSQMEIDEAVAGDVIAIVGLKEATAGETLCDPAQPLVLDGFTCADPVIEAVIEPISSQDQERFAHALAMIAREDPSLRVGVDPESGQTLVRGMGELHLIICAETLKETYNVEVSIGAPYVAYREAITSRTRVDHTHRKQNGGVGQMARVCLILEPRDDSEPGLVYENAIVGGAIPKEYVPSVEKALVEAMREGLVAGYPVHGLKATLVDGAFHAKDSSNLAFELAAKEAFRTAFEKANPILLEPVMRVTVTTPGEYLGGVIGDLNSRRGELLGTDMQANAHEIVALVPLANMFNYVNSLRSQTQGRSSFVMQFDHYGPLPQALQDQVVGAAC